LVNGHLQDLKGDGRIILKRIQTKSTVKTWTEFNWLRTAYSGCFFILVALNLGVLLLKWIHLIRSWNSVTYKMNIINLFELVANSFQKFGRGKASMCCIKSNLHYINKGLSNDETKRKNRRNSQGCIPTQDPHRNVTL
jgi:hypothetical protein